MVGRQHTIPSLDGMRALAIFEHRESFMLHTRLDGLM
jgi:hypothetical protein